jgi:hypothetical protein
MAADSIASASATSPNPFSSASYSFLLGRGEYERQGQNDSKFEQCQGQPRSGGKAVVPPPGGEGKDNEQQQEERVLALAQDRATLDKGKQGGEAYSPVPSRPRLFGQKTSGQREKTQTEHRPQKIR